MKGLIMVDIKGWRREFGITQQALANASGLDVRWIQKIEAGDIDIKNVTVKRFYLLIKGINNLSIQVNDDCKMQNQIEIINGTYKLVSELLKEDML